MVLYITAKTNDHKVRVDFIEMRMTTGEVVSLNWDSSAFSVGKGNYEAEFTGVYFDEEYVNGKLEQLKGTTLKHVEAYSPASNAPAFTITTMRFEDGDEGYNVPSEVIEEYYRV